MAPIDSEPLQPPTSSGSRLKVDTTMSVKYSIDQSQRLIVSVGEGIVGFGDIQDHQNRLLADPDFDPAFDQLIDASRVTSLVLTTDEVKTIASRRVFSPGSLRAFVAVRPYIFGLGRMMEVYHEDIGQVHIFDSMDEALSWLGRSLPVG